MEKEIEKAPQLEVAEQQSRSQHTLRKNKFSLINIIVVTLVLACLGLVIYIFLNGVTSSQPKKTVAQSVEVTPTEIPTPTIEAFNGPLPDIPDSFNTPIFVKRQLNVSENFFYTYDFPDSVKSVSDSQLVGMRCSPWVAPEDGIYKLFYPMKTDKAKESEEVFYKALRYKLWLVTKNPSMRFTFCKSEQGEEYIEYDDGSYVYFGSINADGAIKEIAKMQAVFMTCGYPIQLVNDGRLIFKCRGGESREHAEIYSLNLQNKVFKHYFSCAEDMPGIDPAPPKCEIPSN